jgi:hypothetical protein
MQGLFCCTIANIIAIPAADGMGCSTPHNSAFAAVLNN